MSVRNELLSIGEMARLKNVTVKALRYYERIGVLVPAYVDPQTGYRYYELSQSMDVDVVTMCGELGMPLKELAGYRGPDGKYEMGALLEHGQRIARENLRQARKLMIQADNYREGVSIAQNELADVLPGREFLLLPWEESGFDAKAYVRVSSRIYDIAEQQGCVSLFLMGMVRLPSNGSWNVCIEVKRLDGEADGCGKASGAEGSETAACSLITSNRSNDSGGDSESNESNARFYRAPSGGYESHRIEGASYAKCFSAAFEIPPSAGPLFAFETWERECDPGRVIVDVVVGDALSAG